MNWYPLTFHPILLDKIWGGDYLNKIKNMHPPIPNLGESWEISAVPEKVSIVANGHLAGRSLQYLINQFPQELLGKSVYERFGNKFPLLIKFIDADQDLSIQVHPDDTMAMSKHNSFGKKEMWYILQARNEAQLTIGFKEDCDKHAFAKAVQDNYLPALLNQVQVEPGDAFMINPGTVHAIGAGIALAEIQQSSDITYRVYDYDRKDAQGNTRDLHVDDAMEVSNLAVANDHELIYSPSQKGLQNLTSNPYFTTDIIQFDDMMELDRSSDSFYIFMNVGDDLTIRIDEEVYECQHAQCYLFPAALKFNINIQTTGDGKVLLVHV